MTSGRWSLLSGMSIAVSMLALGCSDAPRMTTAPRPPMRAAFDASTPSAIQAGVLTICKDTPAGTSGRFQIDAWVYDASGTVVKTVGTYINSGQCLDLVSSAPYPTVGTLENLQNGDPGWYLASVTIISGTASTPVTQQLTGVGVGTVDNQAMCSIDYASGKGCIAIFHNAPIVVQPPPQVTGTQGCSPGFWKNSTGTWPETGLSTTATFNSTFGVNAFSSSLTLLQALQQGGGGAKALGRAATAALLNAFDPKVAYPLTSTQIVSAVQAAFAPGGNVTALSNTLNADNNLGCPLANDNSSK